MKKLNSYFLIINAGRKWWKVDLAEFLAHQTEVTSKSEAKRLIDQGAVKITIAPY